MRHILLYCLVSSTFVECLEKVWEELCTGVRTDYMLKSYFDPICLKESEDIVQTHVSPNSFARTRYRQLIMWLPVIHPMSYSAGDHLYLEASRKGTVVHSCGLCNRLVMRVSGKAELINTQKIRNHIERVMG